MQSKSDVTTRIPILMYHSISDTAMPDFKPYCVAPEIFARQLEYLQQHGYTALTVIEFIQIIDRDAAQLPERPVVITFDDGFADFYTDAVPILEKYHFSASIYIATNYVDATSRWLAPQGEGQRAMMTWAQVAELPQHHIEVGGHSHTHPQLDLLPLSAARDEIVRSKSVLETHLNQPVKTFAYPNGYYSPAVQRIVQEAGYTAACAVKYVLSPLPDDRYGLARLIVKDDTDLDTLLNSPQVRAAPARETYKTKIYRSYRFWRQIWDTQITPVQKS